MPYFSVLSLVYILLFRWEEERYTDGSKWRFLEHKGPVFAPPYDPLPDKVKFYYDGESVGLNKLWCLFLWMCLVKTAAYLFAFVGKSMKLSAPAEEVATFFAKMLDHEYTTKDIFRKNFFKDWRKVRSVSV